MTAQERLQQLHASSEPLFAVLDAAQDPAILALLKLHDSPFVSLYAGTSARTMAAEAPYLVALEGQQALLKALLEEGAGHHWGFFFSGKGSLEEWRAHWRQFLLAKLPDGRKLLFRFYDPRVLWPFLESSTQEEQHTVLKGVSSLWLERDKDWIQLKRVEQA